MRYHAEGRRLLSGDKAQPDNVLIVRCNGTAYGDVVECWHDYEKIGHVSRADVPSVLRTMDRMGVPSLTCRWVRMNAAEGFALASAEIDDNDLEDANADWDQWQWDGPVMFSLPEITTATTVAQVLLDKLKQEGDCPVEAINQAIDKLLQVVRYQPYHEMQDVLNQLRHIVRLHPDPAVRGRYDELLCAIQHMASDERRRGFVSEYLPQLMASDQAQMMISRWEVECLMRASDHERRLLMESLVLEAEEALRHTPTRVHYPLRCEQDMLWHQVLYSRIPMRAWMRLLSLLVMRNHLSQVLGLDSTELPVDEPWHAEQYQPTVPVTQQVREPEPVYNRPRGEETPADPSREVLSKYIRRKEWLDDAVYNISHATDDREVAEWVRKMNKEGKINLDRRKEALLRDLKALGICHMGRSRWFEYLS